MSTPKRKEHPHKDPVKKAVPVKPKRKTTKSVGRPTGYRRTICPKVIQWGADGKTWTSIAALLGITRDTLYQWTERHPEFSDAMKLSRQLAQMWWEDTLAQQARGELPGGNATAAIFAMKNQFPDDYKDRREIEHTGELKLVEVDFMGFDEDAVEAEWEEI